MTPQDPFFTNDGIGLLKLGGLLVSIVGPTIALIVKLWNSRIARDVDGLGGRVSKVETDLTGTSTQVQSLDRQLVITVGQVAALHETQGALAQQLKVVADGGAQKQAELMEVITRTSGEQMRAVHQLELQLVALQTTLQERASMTAELERLGFRPQER